MSIFTAGNCTPFTYLIKCVPTNEYYYGVRYAIGCQPSDLWTTYFTSSKKIAQRIALFGASAFQYEVRRTFDCPHKARLWEDKVLRKMKVIFDQRWINQHYGNTHQSRRTIQGKKMVYMIEESRYSYVEPLLAQHLVAVNLAELKGRPRSKEAAKQTSAKLRNRPKAKSHVDKAVESFKCNPLNKGYKYYTDGNSEIRIRNSDEIPEGFTLGRRAKPIRPNVKSSLKGKSYVELHGEEKAKQLQHHKSDLMKKQHKNYLFKGKTYEEIHGEEKAERLRYQRAQSKLKVFQVIQEGITIFEGSREEVKQFFVSTYRCKSALYNKDWLTAHGFIIQTRRKHHSHDPH